MSKPTLAINGFGRMGRLALRDALQQTEYELVLVNEIGGDAAAAAHLLEFDSVHGRYAAAEALPIRSGGGDGAGQWLDVGGQRIRYTSSAAIADSDWSGVDIVLDATGVRRHSPDFADYFAAGVAKVLVSAPVKDGPLNVVYGVNDHLYRPAEHHLVTAASCTTNCIAPVLGVLLKTFGVRRGAFTSIHALTNTQRVLDGFHSDLRRARSSATSLIPTSTGSATAIFEIFPELLDRLDGVAVRVPVAQASIADLTLELETEVDPEAVNAAFSAAAESELAGVLGVESRPLVSIDYEGERRSAVIDAPSTRVIDGSIVKLLAWYDNETGYVARMMELVARVAREL